MIFNYLFFVLCYLSKHVIKNWKTRLKLGAADPKIVFFRRPISLFIETDDARAFSQTQALEAVVGVYTSLGPRCSCIWPWTNQVCLSTSLLQRPSPMQYSSSRRWWRWGWRMGWEDMFARLALSAVARQWRVWPSTLWCCVSLWQWRHAVCHCQS